MFIQVSVACIIGGVALSILGHQKLRENPDGILGDALIIWGHQVTMTATFVALAAVMLSQD